MIVRKIICWGTIGVFALTAIVGTFHRDFLFSTSTGCRVEIRQSSLFKLPFGSKCDLRISCLGQTNILELLQDPFRSPVIVVPSSETNILFCVYDNDVDWQVIRIDLGQPFAGIASSNPLNSIVLRSNCKIERVLKEDVKDWNLLADSIERMPARQFRSETVHFAWLVTNQKQLASSMSHFGDQGQYPGDLFVPDYSRLRTAKSNGLPPSRR